MTVSLLKQAMAEAFSQLPRTYSFFTDMARSADTTHVFTASKIPVDILRGKELFAVDVVRGTGGRSSSLRKFSTKTYEPPVYDENTPMGPEELLSRMPGVDPFQDPRASQGMATTIVQEQSRLMDKIIRAIEKQASDALFTGQIPLVNGDTIDFKQKATHAITVGTAWTNVAADALGDIGGAIAVNRTDGLIESDTLIMGADALKNFLALTQMKDQANFRRINQIQIDRPTWFANGGVLHGELTVGSHNLTVWSYPQEYEVPLGFSLPNEGTKVPYVPADAVLVMSSSIRFDLYFAGLPILVPTAGTELAGLVDSMPQFTATRFQPYGNTDTRRTNIEVGVRSAPLFVPTQIDGFATLDTIP